MLAEGCHSFMLLWGAQCELGDRSPGLCFGAVIAFSFPKGDWFPTKLSLYLNLCCQFYNRLLGEGRSLQNDNNRSLEPTSQLPPTPQKKEAAAAL